MSNTKALKSAILRYGARLTVNKSSIIVTDGDTDSVYSTKADGVDIALRRALSDLSDTHGAR